MKTKKEYLDLCGTGKKEAKTVQQCKNRQKENKYSWTEELKKIKVGLLVAQNEIPKQTGSSA